jgi:uncharacterized membrane protein (DUF485 family)
MTLTEKRLLKKKARIYFTSSIAFVVLFFLYFPLVGLSEKIFGQPFIDYIGLIPAVSLLVMPILFAMICMNISSVCTSTLRGRMADIKLCRQYKFFHDGIQAIVDGDIEKALFIHDRLLSNDYARLNSKFYYFLVNELSHSKNKKYKKMGDSEIADILAQVDKKIVDIKLINT